MQNDLPDYRSELSGRDCSMFLNFALEALETTRPIIMSYWEKGNFNVESKDDASPVTEADLKSEEAFRDLVAKRFPTHGLIGEEFPSVNPESEFQWTIDPIDGTQNFALGIPTFGTMLSLRFRNRPIVGVIENPALRRLVQAAYGMGTYCDGRLVSIVDSGVKTLTSDTVVLIATRAMFGRTNEEALFDNFMQQHSVTRIYYDCFGHSLVAGGNAPAMVEFNVKIWDSSPTEILVEEAGGKFQYVRELPEPTKRNPISMIFGQASLVDVLGRHFMQPA